MSASKSLKVAILGSGWGLRVQIPAFRKAGLEIVAVYSRSQKRAEESAAKFNVPSAYSDLSALFASDVDLISIVTPPLNHKDIFLAAIQAGKHVLCEKPTALNAAEAELMLKASQNNAKQIALIDHELRFLPSMRKMKQLISEGHLGNEIYGMEAINTSGGRIAPRAYTWWHDKSSGGGVLGAIGSHLLDSLTYLTGRRVTSVSGTLQTNVKQQLDSADNSKFVQVTSDDFCSVQLKFNDNSVGNILCSVVKSGPSVHRLSVYGPKGTLTIDGPKLLWSPVTTTSTGVATETIVDDTDFMDKDGLDLWGFATVLIGKAIQEAALTGNREPLSPGATLEDALYTQKFLDAVRKSHEEAKWIDV